MEELSREAFGSDFIWGVSVAAYQIEGGFNEDGKGLSIWDTFSNKKRSIYQSQNGNIACDFYHRYQQDIDLIKILNIPHFRFSLSWARMIPNGSGHINDKGVDFYHRVIDYCLENNIQPWITLYHWDLPQALETKGGWTNRDIVYHFADFVELAAIKYGDRMKYWMVMNEPMVFTGAGYFLGIHAPGRRGMKNFIPAMHHACLAMSEGGRRLKGIRPLAEVGTTFSCSDIHPYSDKEKDVKAAVKTDALLNRLYIEPILGLGYPKELMNAIYAVEKYYKSSDDQLISFDFDFIGIQNYTREVVKHSLFTPYLNARLVNAKERKVPHTLMNWEVYPPAIYNMLKKFNSYSQIKKIIVTENGAAFSDQLQTGQVHDTERINYLTAHINQVLKAKQDGVKVDGYFVWTLMDNFEWAEGYHPRFGLVYVNFASQERIIKNSGLWYSRFLGN